MKHIGIAKPNHPDINIYKTVGADNCILILKKDTIETKHYKVCYKLVDDKKVNIQYACWFDDENILLFNSIDEAKKALLLI
jgi:hypothetical protein